MKYFRTIACFLLLALTFLLPLKFTQIAGLPAVPAAYPESWQDFLYFNQPTVIFVFASAFILAMLLLGGGFRQTHRLRVFAYACGWLLLSLCAAAGKLDASCAEYPRQSITMFLGVSLYACSVYFAVNGEDGHAWALRLLTAMTVGIFVSCMVGLDQALFALDDLRGQTAGMNLSPELRRQIASSRVFGTFPICNILGAVAAAILPFIFFAVRNWTEKRWHFSVSAACTLAGICCAIPGYVLWQTGSRGAVLALAAGIFGMAYFRIKTVQGRRNLLLACIPCAVLFGLYVWLNRGFGSAIFRLDYDWAALKMMFSNPLTGTGWGDFYHEYPSLKLLVNDEYPHSPHNFPLLFGSQCGIAGFLLSLSLLAYPLWMARKAVQTDSCYAGAFAFLAILSAASLLEISVEVPAFACAMSVGGFYLLTAPGECREEEKTVPASACVWFYIFLCISIYYGVSRASDDYPREQAFARYYHLRYEMEPYDQDPCVSFQHAQFLWLEALEKAPDNPFIRAEAPFFVEDRLALTQLGIARRLSPEDSSLYWSYADILDRLQLHKEAENSRRKARELSPNDPKLREE